MRVGWIILGAVGIGVAAVTACGAFGGSNDSAPPSATDGGAPVAEGGDTTNSDDDAGSDAGLDAGDPSAANACDAANCEVIATGQSSPSAIVADSKSMAWANHSTTGAIMRCPLAGCGTTPYMLVSVTNPVALALDDTYAYYSDEAANVSAAPRAGGQSFPITTGSSPTKGANRLFSISSMGIYACGDPAPTDASKNCASGAVDYLIASGVDRPQLLAADASNVYWNDMAGQIVACTHSSATCASQQRVVTTGQPSVIAFSVDTTHLYWLLASGEIRSVLKTGGTDGGATGASDLATVPNGTAIAGDLDAIYVGTSTGRVLAFAKADGSKTILATGLAPVRGVADAGKVLLVTSGDRVLRITKS